MSKNAKKTPNDYPVMTFRPDEETLKRINRLKERSGLSASQIVSMCIRAHLKNVETSHQ